MASKVIPVSEFCPWKLTLDLPRMNARPEFHDAAVLYDGQKDFVIQVGYKDAASCEGLNRYAKATGAYVPIDGVGWTKSTKFRNARKGRGENALRLMSWQKLRTHEAKVCSMMRAVEKRVVDILVLGFNLLLVSHDAR